MGIALLAALILIPLLYLPGWILMRLWPAVAADAPLLEQIYLRAVWGALLNGWLAFSLAQLGIFSAWLHLLVLAGACGLGLGWLWRRRSQKAAVLQQAAPARATWSWAQTAMLLPILVFALLVAQPFEVVLGVRDAGTYANTGFAIARHGGIVQSDQLLAQIAMDQRSSDTQLRAAAEQAETNFLGVQNPERFIATRLRAAGFFINAGELIEGRVIPQHFHLFPAWIGLLSSLLGLHAGLLATGLMGLLGVWSVGMLGWRLAGPWVGVTAALLLALNGVQVWFGRYSTTETTAQLLIFAGLYGFVLMQQQAGRPEAHSAALLSGLAFGQLALARIDFFLALAPLLLYLLYRWLTRRWDQAQSWLGLGAALMLLQAGLHVALIARAYLFDTLFARLQDYALTALLSMPFLTETLRAYYLTRPNSVVGIRLGPGVGLYNWPRIVLELSLLLAVVAALLVLRWRGQRLLQRIEGWLQRAARPLTALAALGLLLLAAYAYLLRPQILTPQLLAALPGCLAPAQLSNPNGACLTLQGYIGAPIALPAGADPRYAIPLASLVRVGWYLSPLGIVLAAAGLALWLWRGLTRDSWLLLSIGLLTAFVFLRQTYGTSDQTYIYILRRYVPVVYPLFCLGIAYALAGLAAVWNGAGRPGLHVLRRGFAAGLLAALLLFLLVTNRTLYRHVEYAGTLAQIEAFAAHFAPEDVVLLRSGGRDEPDTLATPLRFAFDLNALTIKSSDPGRYAEQLANYVAHWQAQGRTVYLLLGPSGAVSLPGQNATLLEAVRLETQEFQQLTDQKPSLAGPLTLDYRLYRLSPQPASVPATIAADDYLYQLRGFYRPEQFAGQLAAWTDGAALLRLPWSGTSRLRLAISLSGGVRPADALPVEVCLTLAPEQSLALDDRAALQSVEPRCLQISGQFAEYVVEFDLANLTSQSETLRLSISSNTWIPANVDSAQHDRRQLGVLFGGLRIEPELQR